MEQLCFALPIVPGRSNQARALMQAVEGPRRREYAQSARRLGIVRESWYLQRTQQGDMFVAHLESLDLHQALQLFAGSAAPFERWFKQQLRDVTGIDLNHLATQLFSEQLSSYEASDRLSAKRIEHLHV